MNLNRVRTPIPTLTLPLNRYCNPHAYPHLTLALSVTLTLTRTLHDVVTGSDVDVDGDYDSTQK